MVKFVKMVGPCVPALVIGHLINSASSQPHRRAKRDLDFFQNAFGSEFDWLNDDGVDLDSGENTGAAANPTELLPMTTEFYGYDYDRMVNDYDGDNEGEEEEAAPSRPKTSTPKKVSSGSSNGDESEDEDEAPVEGWSWLEQMQSNAAPVAKVGPTEAYYDYGTTLLDGEPNFRSASEGTTETEDEDLLNVKEEMDKFVAKMETNLVGKTSEESLIAKLNNIQKIKQKKSILNTRADEQVEKLEIRAELAIEKVAREDDRVVKQAAKAVEATRISDWQAGKPARIQASIDVRQEAQSVKEAAIDAAKIVRLDERDAKNVIKDAAAAARIVSADDRAASKVIAEAREAENLARKASIFNDGGELKKEHKAKCRPMAFADNISIEDGIKSKLDTSDNFEKCNSAVEGDICRFGFTADACGAGSAEPVFKVAGETNKFQKLSAMKCIKNPEDADDLEGYWVPTAFGDGDTTKHSLKFSCGGCQYPKYSNFDTGVITFGEGESSSRARVTYGRGLDFDCYDKDNQQIFCTGAMDELVPIDGWCKPSCINTYIEAIDFKIKCAAVEVDEVKQPQLFAKMDTVNSGKTEWKYLSKLHEKLTMPKFASAKGFVKMPVKWAEEADKAIDELQNGYICYQDDQPIYTGEWSEWSVCNGRGWRTRTRDCTGSCGDAFQYEKCD